MEETTEERVEETPVETSTPKKSMAPLFTVGLLVALGVVAFLYFRGGKNTVETPTPTSQAVESVETESTSDVAGVKEFTVNGSSFEFAPETITVNKGDSVKITFKDIDSRHDLVIDGYNVRTDIIGPGATDTIEFVADIAGTFEYYCSVANHKEQGMTGTLIVQ